jgi:hypothetical protein
MQLLVQVVCTPGKSLRESIAKHARISEHGLVVSQQLNPERSNGWMKLHSTRPDRDGAINVQWDSNSSILLARIVTRGKGDSSLIAGDFVAFLLRRFKRRVHSIILVPPR